MGTTTSTTWDEQEHEYEHEHDAELGTRANHTRRTRSIPKTTGARLGRDAHCNLNPNTL